MTALATGEAHGLLDMFWLAKCGQPLTEEERRAVLLAREITAEPRCLTELLARIGRAAGPGAAEGNEED